MPKLTKLTYRGHKITWSACTNCELCRVRKNVVLFRGAGKEYEESGKSRLPCDVLMIGEAPGESEDSLRRPFIGPAGKLLDSIIYQASQLSNVWPVIGMTNLVACIPLEEGEKLSEPLPEHIGACSKRLNEILKLANPDVIIRVGKLATEWVPKITNIEVPFTDIVHPAALLRMEPAQRVMNQRKCVVELADAFEKLIPF